MPFIYYTTKNNHGNGYVNFSKKEKVQTSSSPEANSDVKFPSHAGEDKGHVESDPVEMVKFTKFQQEMLSDMTSNSSEMKSSLFVENPEENVIIDCLSMEDQNIKNDTCAEALSNEEIPSSVHSDTQVENRQENITCTSKSKGLFCTKRSFKECKLKGLKRYVGVHIIGFRGSNHVIPKSWIYKWLKKNKKCRWPKENPAGLAKACMESQDDWSSYNIEPLCHANTYKKCVEMLCTMGNETSSYDSEVAGNYSVTSENFVNTVDRSTTSEQSTSGLNEQSSLVKPVFSTAMTPTRPSIESESQTPGQKLPLQTSTIQYLKKIVEVQLDIEKKVNFLMSRMEEKDEILFPPPADSVDELDLFTAHDNLVSTLSQVGGHKPLDTTRMLIRKLMTRNLALQFSVTGLGDRRQPTKISFKNHSLCKFVINAVIARHSVDDRDVYDHLSTVFKGCRDWDGGRKLRRKETNKRTKYCQFCDRHIQNLSKHLVKEHGMSRNVAIEICCTERSQRKKCPFPKCSNKLFTSIKRHLKQVHHLKPGDDLYQTYSNGTDKKAVSNFAKKSFNEYREYLLSSDGLSMKSYAANKRASGIRTILTNTSVQCESDFSSEEFKKKIHDWFISTATKDSLTNLQSTLTEYLIYLKAMGTINAETYDSIISVINDRAKSSNDQLKEDEMNDYVILRKLNVDEICTSRAVRSIYDMAERIECGVLKKLSLNDYNFYRNITLMLTFIKNKCDICNLNNMLEQDFGEMQRQDNHFIVKLKDLESGTQSNMFLDESLHKLYVTYRNFVRKKILEERLTLCPYFFVTWTGKRLQYEDMISALSNAARRLGLSREIKRCIIRKVLSTPTVANLNVPENQALEVGASEEKSVTPTSFSPESVHGKITQPEQMDVHSDVSTPSVANLNVPENQALPVGVCEGKSVTPISPSPKYVPSKITQPEQMDVHSDVPTPSGANLNVPENQGFKIGICEGKSDTPNSPLPECVRSKLARPVQMDVEITKIPQRGRQVYNDYERKVLFSVFRDVLICERMPAVHYIRDMAKTHSLLAKWPQAKLETLKIRGALQNFLNRIKKAKKKSKKHYEDLFKEFPEITDL